MHLACYGSEDMIEDVIERPWEFPMTITRTFSIIKHFHKEIFLNTRSFEGFLEDNYVGTYSVC